MVTDQGSYFDVTVRCVT